MSRRIAVLSKKDLPYDDWVGGVGEVVVFAQDDPAARARAARPGSGYTAGRLFPDWKANRGVDLAVVAAHRETPFDRVVALSECDQVRAGELRDTLGLPGQGAAGATAFRDKVVMKRLASAAGLGVPAFAAAESPWDVLDLAGRHRRLVLKPRDGAGSLGVLELSSGGPELDAWLAARPLGQDEPTRLVVEEYVDAPMVVVDGAMAGGELIASVVSRYRTSCYDQLTELRPQGVLHLSPDDPAARRATEYTGRLVRALPCPAEPTSFHCELFDDPLRGMLLCEIAARTGGCLFNDATRVALGIDLERWSFLGQAGVPADELPREPAGGYAGSLCFPRPGRVLADAPATCPVDGVLDYRLHARVGEFVPQALKSSQNVVEILFGAARADDLDRVHREALRWTEQHVRWR